MTAKNLDLGSKLRTALNHRRELGNIVPEDQIPGAEASSVGDRMIPVDDIDFSPYQPRLQINQEALEALAESIKEIGGIIQPIIVRSKENGRFELVAGERRLRAFRMCGYREIPAIIRHLSDKDAVRMCVTENLQREGLTAYEVAKALRGLKGSGVCSNNSELARLTGISRTNIIFHLRFLDLPQAALDIMEANPGIIGAKTASDLAKLCDEGHADLVVQALMRVRDGKLPSSNANDWIRARCKGQARRHDRREYATVEGRPIGTLSRANKRISLSIVDEDLLNEAVALLEAFMVKASQRQAAGEQDQGVLTVNTP